MKLKRQQPNPSTRSLRTIRSPSGRRSSSHGQGMARYGVRVHVTRASRCGLLPRVEQLPMTG